jgi:hypothetical protein
VPKIEVSRRRAASAPRVSGAAPGALDAHGPPHDDALSHVLARCVRSRAAEQTTQPVLQRAKRKKGKKPDQRELEQANPTMTAGAQDLIQPKLVGICELVRQQRHVPLTPAITAWYAGIALNGLCAGWAEIHKNEPGWIEDLWTALTSWTPPPGASPDEQLDHLNAHMQSEVEWCRSGRGADELVTLLTTAWEAMDRLEPNAAYGPVPAWLSDRAKLQASARPHAKKTVTVRVLNGGRAVVEHIRTMIGEKNAHFIVNIATDAHAMSVRIRRTAKTLSLVAVETEKTGIASCSSWEQLMRVLQGGLLVGEHDEERRVDLETFKAARAW